MSPSGYDLLGYEPEELLGRPVYEIISPEQHASAQEFYAEYAENDLIASQIVTRVLAKDGRTVLCATVACICYDFSAAIEFAGMKHHHREYAEHSRSLQALEPEARVCMIINRFTMSLTIMYASSECQKVLQVDPDDITGKPILLYIRSDDLAPFVEQVDLVKTTTTVAQLRFWFQSPNARYGIPCEAMVAGTPDGIVAVIRNCKPFVRKRFIASSDQFDASSRGSSVSSRYTPSYGSTPASEPSVSPSAMGRGSYGTTPSPPRNAPREALNRIRIFEIDDERPSQHTAAENQDSSLPFHEVIVQDYREEDEDSFDDDNVDTVVRGVAISRLDDDGNADS
ncbi:hypothetical protein BGX31_003561 [Mortierella sp. GBA43]|nr:hypothetical protein BGX31_003561 [Mortierella sp. GBA43]